MRPIATTNLTAADMARLRGFKISEDLIELHEIRRVTDHEARIDCGIIADISDLSGVVYPIFGADGQIKAYRVRRDNPEIRNGKPDNKYVMSVDRPHLYFERTSRQYLANPAIPMILVESYTAALAIAAWGVRTKQSYLIVSTAGCWGWSGTIGLHENENGKRVPEKGISPDFSLIELKGRDVLILFDSDVVSSQSVRSARKRLTHELHEMSAVVRWPVIPEPDGRKMGPDDFLSLHTDEELIRILDSAKTTKKYETPFKLIDDAVLFRLEIKDKETGEVKTTWRRICSYLEIGAETRDDRGENWGRILVVKDRDGKLHEWAMPMGILAGDGTACREQLLSLGLEIEPGRFPKDKLHEYISTAKPEERARCVTRVGWHPTPSGIVYVLPDRTFGANIGCERVLLQSAGTEQQNHYQVSGSLEDWQQNVGKFGCGNSRLAFALSLAFAPPLMEFAGEPSGGVHIRGQSSTGKTTLLHMAGSVWGGGGTEGFIRNWRATSNGLEATAAQHNDALLCIDELSQIDSHDAGEAAYMLSNGTGKSRARKDGSGRIAAQWRLLFLSTGEVSLADKMSETGRKPHAGQEVRLVDVPADAECGLGVFEDIHGFPSADVFARTLKENALRYYGTPIRAYLEKLAGESGYIEAIARARADFISRYVPPNASGQVSRVANRFALIAAAGSMATVLGILPWAGDEAANAVAKCFHSWLEQRGTSGNQEGITAIRQVRRFFELHGQSRFTDWNAPEHTTINRAGFRRSDDEGGVEYYVFPEVFREDICGGLNGTFVAKELIARKYLVPDGTGKAQRTERLPGMESKRVYRITSAILEGDTND